MMAAMGAPAGRPQAPARPGEALAAIDTPALLLDLDAFEANVVAMHASVRSAGLRLRAHGKAHKCPEIARRQVAAGAVGLCVQKVGEAEVFVAAGITDVLISNEVVGASKAARVAALARSARIGLCVDDPLQVAQIGQAALQAGSTVEVLIEIDVGQGRCGVGTPAQALVLAQAIAGFAPALRLRGLQAYQGRAQHLRSPDERRIAIEAAALQVDGMRAALIGAGYGCDEVSGGGTGSFVNEIASGRWTELQPGSYVLMDRDYNDNQADPRAPALAQALFGWCTVISARPGHAVLDGGLKAFAVDSGLPTVLVPGWSVRGLSDEHAVLAAADGAVPLAVGDKLRLVPGHCDPTVNLHDWLVAVRGERVEQLWPIAARGAMF